jgi:hypothetical protein
LYSPHLQVGAKRLPAAFLLKGPAKFAAMTLNTLGKNSDQIVRLAHEPAQLLIVQRCHQITQAVRETLRAFTIQLGSPRGAEVLGAQRVGAASLADVSNSSVRVQVAVARGRPRERQ